MSSTGARRYHHGAGRNRKSLFVLPCWAVDAAGAVGGGAAPDALIAAGTVAMLARGRVDAA